MITNSLFIQVFMVVLAAAILFLYIKPTVAEVRSIQSQISIYEGELVRVNDVNQILDENTQKIDALPKSDVQALERYIPNKIDEISVLRDLQAVVSSVGVELTGLEYLGGNTNSDQELVAEGEEVSVSDTLYSSTFKLSVLSSYSGLKNLLKALEVNNYPLVVKSVNVAPVDSGLLEVNIEVMVYSLEPPAVVTEASEE